MKWSFAKTSSIKTKLLLVFITVCTLVLLLISISLAWLLNNTFKESLIEAAEANLDIIAFNLAPAVSFQDEQTAEQILQSLSTVLHVEYARVEVKEGEELVTLAEYYKSGGERASIIDFRQNQAVDMIDNTLQLSAPIVADEEVIGNIYQMSVFTELDAFKKQTLFIVIASVLGCSLLAAFLARNFQGVVLEPLNKLINVADRVSMEKDYTLRLQYEGKDEFSTLSKSFDNMLDVIETQRLKQLTTEQEIRMLNASLEQKVAQRTQELELTNKDLVDTLSQLKTSQSQLIETEKMASLGSLVAGVAHEINTPIGIGVTSASLLQDLFKDLNKHYLEQSITKHHLEDVIDKGMETTGICLVNLSRAAELISSFKQVAVDQTSEVIREVNLSYYLNEIITSLKPKLKKGKHNIILTCDEQLSINIKASFLSQIITNLVLNSVIHGFEGREHGEIRISVAHTEHDIFIEFKDNGIGLDEQALNLLFEPFYTTKRNDGGSGLGAHIVYNIVTQGLGGRIRASSPEGEGLCYQIALPIGQQNV